MRLGLITDKARILNLLHSLSDFDLGTSSTNLILLKTCDDSYRVLDLDKDPEADIEEWLNKNSIDSVFEMDEPHIAKLIDMIKVPTLLLFVGKDLKSEELLSSMKNDLAKKYQEHLSFIYIRDKRLFGM